MAGLIDGLGYEELGDATGTGDTGSKVAALWVTGSVTSESQISGLNVFATGSVAGARINDSNGPIFSVSVGSPATYGLKIQAGSIVTAAGSGATIVFGTQFTNNQYKVAFGNVGGSVVAFVSGTTNVSGCAVVGAASQTYNYIAMGA